MTDMPETITLAPLHDSTYVEYSTIGRFVNGAVYRRADLPPTPEQIAADPRVRALVEASTHALPAVRGLIEAAQKYGVFDNLLPELFPDSTRRGVKRADGFANVMSAQANAQAWLDCLEIALAAFRAEGGE
jgi:hypothetical protein